MFAAFACANEMAEQWRRRARAFAAEAEMDSGRELADDDAARGGAPGVVVSDRSGRDKEDMGRIRSHPFERL